MAHANNGRQRRGALLGDGSESGASTLREKYMQPIVPWQMGAMLDAGMGPTHANTILYGLVNHADMEGYAAHVATGCPWYSTQAAFLVLLAPASASDRLFAKHSKHMVPKTARIARHRFDPKPIIALIDRAQLRAKYENIARLYLTGQWPATREPRTPTIQEDDAA